MRAAASATDLFILRTACALCCAWLLGTGCSTSGPDSMRSKHPLAVTRLPHYREFSEAYSLNNGIVEAIVVPAVGRVLQFGFVSEEGVFWENPALSSAPREPGVAEWRTNEWLNFGGDKAWPAPEGEWSRWTGRAGWRPPLAFDGMGWDARIDGRDLILTSAVDPFYGIRCVRRIHLPPAGASMSIRTEFEKVTGAPVAVGIWVVTQLKHPVTLLATVPRQSIFSGGYTLLSKAPPPDLKVEQGALSLGRNPSSAFKIGLDADSLVWVGEKQILRIDSARVANAEYPDKGSSTEIYTNPDPLPYIELETLGPVQRMKAGDKIERTNLYTLQRRSQGTLEGDTRVLHPR